MSSNVIPEIPMKLAKVFGMETPSYGVLFNDPIWVINCGQNSLTSHVIYQERLAKAMGVYPDYIVLLIGTNDILGIHDPSLRSMYATMHGIKESDITMSALRNNILQICKFIREASPKVELGVCTIPPIGEDLSSSSINGLVQEANQYITKIVTQELQDDRTTVIPLYEQMETIIEKNRSKKKSFSRWYMHAIDTIGFPLYFIFNFISWNTISSIAGYTLLTDGVHFNDTARDIFADTIVDWLKQRNITKVMAIKSL
jgi:lysophospholipase L1-like esterase